MPIGVYPRKLRPVADRFWEKVDKSGECWLWIGAKSSPWLYGNLLISGRKYRLAHRISWELTYGSIPDGLCVLHHCDNPSCVRPSHLWLGTQLDNSKDCIAKGRDRRGEQHPMAKLTEGQVIEIYRVHMDEGLSHRALASRFGVSPSCINDVLTGKNWAHVF